MSTYYSDITSLLLSWNAFNSFNLNINVQTNVLPILKEVISFFFHRFNHFILFPIHFHFPFSTKGERRMEKFKKEKIGTKENE